MDEFEKNLLDENVKLDKTVDIDALLQNISMEAEKADFIEHTPENLIDNYNSQNFSERDNNKEFENNYKKFVIYVYPSNISIADKLSTDEFTKLVNDSLREYDNKAKQKQQTQKKCLFAAHVVLVILTVLIFTPIFYIGLNKSIVLTRTNYIQHEQNFSTLYSKNKKPLKAKDFKKLQRIRKKQLEHAAKTEQ